MALNQMGLGFLFTAKDEASAVIGRIERNLGSLGGQTEQLQKGLFQGAIGATAMMGGVIALRTGFSIAKEAGEFQQALIDVKSISGASAAELKALESAAIQAGIATQFSPQQAVGGLRDLAAAGYNAHDSIKLLNPALALAAGSLGELTPQQAAGVAAQTLKAFKLAADDAAISVDKLLMTANLFAVQTNELPALIGHVVRGAASYGTSLTEALTSAGLARNVLGNIELASTGVSVAMERLVKADSQKALKSIGVDVVDATGKFVPFLDVLTKIGESADFQKMTEAGKAGFLNGTFGHHALGAVQSILVQLNGGITDLNGNTLKGADAVAYYRDQFEKAQGTAKKFADARLDSLPGQLQLLNGSMETLRIVVGKELAPVFRPIVEGILGGVNRIISAWRGLSEGTRSGLTKFFVGAAALVTVFGSIVAFKASFALLGVVLGTLGTSVGALFAGFLPITGVLLGLAGVSGILYAAYRKNFGGFADSVQAAWNKVSLAVSGVWQLFSNGYFSGAVMEDLNKAGNGGIKNFAITVFSWVERIKTFFGGLADGFSATAEQWRPVWTGLLETIGKFAGLLGLSRGAAADNADTFDKFTQAGRDLGAVLSNVVGWALEIVRVGLNVVGWAVQTCQTSFNSLGKGIAASVQVIWGTLKVFMGLLTGNWDLVWSGMIDVVIGAVKRIVNLVYGLGAVIAGIFDTINGWVGINSTFKVDLVAQRDFLLSGLDESAQFWKRELASGEVPGTQKPVWTPQIQTLTGGPPVSPAAAANEGQAQAVAAAVTAGLANMSMVNANMSPVVPPVYVSMNIDGERIGSAVARVKRSSDARSFMSVGPEED